ncbi:lysozyme c-1-like [Leptopilina heterotoma]|uniref:lysozyme c-1-like n=1 Tax=Leptopilina heterotoma TaxID=63436 RepID=UPI001CA7D95E|nr:lysozyme c-1-like [Leptopilina heterotoma]
MHLMGIFLPLIIILGYYSPAQGKVLTQCEAAQELVKGGVSRSFISNFVCLMKSESGLDTRKKTGPKTMSSYCYGVFQINSAKWCEQSRKGGVCNKKCDEFITDDIQDDVACAKMIHSQEGFNHWPGWVKDCKNKALPDLSGCKY